MANIPAVSPPTSLDHYRLLGRSGLRVSPLCLGTMTFGTDWGWGADKDVAKQQWDAYAEAGGNFIDTANFYTNGTSEKFVGEFLKDNRDWFVLATKYTLNPTLNTDARPNPNAGGNHRKNLMRSVEASLKRLDTDYIDLLYVHMWDFTTPVDEVMRGLDDLIRMGKINYIGMSDAPAWKVAQCNTMAELMGWSRFIALQIKYALTERTPERDLIPMADDLGLGVLPWSPLDNGILAGKYSQEDVEKEKKRREAGENMFNASSRMTGITQEKLDAANEIKKIADEVGQSAPQVALNWLLTRPTVVSPIVGARKLDQLKDNLAAVSFSLSEDQLKRLDDLSAVSLGFPHDFLQGATGPIFAGTSIERPTPTR